MNKKEKILRKSANFLKDPKKWHRYSLHNEAETKFCMTGTIKKFCKGDRDLFVEICNLVHREVFDWESMGSFNDYIAKSNLDVVAVLEIAADLAADPYVP